MRKLFYQEYLHHCFRSRCFLKVAKLISWNYRDIKKTASPKSKNEVRKIKPLRRNMRGERDWVGRRQKVEAVLRKKYVIEIPPRFINLSNWGHIFSSLSFIHEAAFPPIDHLPITIFREELSFFLFLLCLPQSSCPKSQPQRQ